MPELPEVETIKRGIGKQITHQTISNLIIRQRQLRWRIPNNIEKKLIHSQFTAIKRRGKYLLFETDSGHLMIHLGMSGYLRIFNSDQAAGKHDHVEIHFANHTMLRLTDPRRFGCVLWINDDPLQHKLLKNLGPEPLSKDFNLDYLFAATQARKANIKSVIMNSQIVVGVGNIYACESLFRAGIDPQKPANQIAQKNLEKLITAIKNVLTEAIDQGGTTLKDFQHSDGKPGYFKQKLRVYDRRDQACMKCGNKIKLIRLNQRSTYFCPDCQR